MRLVYLSPVPWESFAQRPHKFVEWYNKRTGGPVLWIDPYPTRFPRIDDIFLPRPSCEKKLSAGLPSWLTVLKPGGHPVEPLPCSGWLNSGFWKNIFVKFDDFKKNSRTLLAIGKPSVMAIAMLDRFSYGMSLYDAMDDFPAFYSGFSRFAMKRRERQIVQRVESVWASSTELYKRWSICRNDVCLVHNGLDLTSLPFNAELKLNSEKKIFGYVGTIASWFDWDWVLSLSEARPEDEICLIGPIFNKPKKSLPKNIKILPACDHHTALRSMMKFDVGLIPFKPNMLTNSVDPIKYYEYRAVSLPVISTNFGELRYRYADPGLFISHSTDDIPSIAAAALMNGVEPCVNDEFALQHAWDVRFDAAKLIV